MLDTNVVLDLFVFDDVDARPLRAALDAGQVSAITNAATLEEWRRVLAYPAFARDHAAQQVLFDHYARLAECCAEVAALRLPRCADPDDQKFLELAAAAGADVLVTKDRALLKLARRCRFRITTPRGLAVRIPLGAIQAAASA